MCPTLSLLQPKKEDVAALLNDVQEKITPELIGSGDKSPSQCASGATTGTGDVGRSMESTFDRTDCVLTM